jgi:hypothetical protein
LESAPRCTGTIRRRKRDWAFRLARRAVWRDRRWSRKCLLSLAGFPLRRAHSLQIVLH